jgi:hypothetical protein
MTSATLTHLSTKQRPEINRNPSGKLCPLFWLILTRGERLRSKEETVSIDFIAIPAEVLQCPDINDKQKMLLGLIIGFYPKGLMMSNDELGKLLMLNSDYVSQLINDLEAKKYIRITAAQSKYRKIYFEKNLKVDDSLLLEKPQSKTVLLRGKPKHTLRKTSNIIQRNINNTTLAQCFNDLWSKYPKKTAKADAEKAFNKLNPDKVLFDTIMAALARHKQTESWQKENGKYIPKLVNWLKGERWKDELPELDGGGIVQTQDCEPEEAERLRFAMKEAGY